MKNLLLILGLFLVAGSATAQSDMIGVYFDPIRIEDVSGSGTAQNRMSEKDGLPHTVERAAQLIVGLKTDTPAEL